MLKGILVMRALPFGQRVFIADAGHQVAEASDPGSGLLWVGRHQVQGLHVVPVVHRETAGRVEAAVGMPMKDVRLAALRHFVQGIDGNWRNEDVGKWKMVDSVVSERKETRRLLIASQIESNCRYVLCKKLHQYE